MNGEFITGPSGLITTDPESHVTAEQLARNSDCYGVFFEQTSQAWPILSKESKNLGEAAKILSLLYLM